MSEEAEEFIELNDLINQPDKIPTSEPLQEPLQKLYQIQGMTDKEGAYIKCIGQDKIRPVITVHKFTFRQYGCEIVSYILSDVDVKLDSLKMLGLLIKDNEKVVATITMCFKLLENNNSILDLLDTNESKILLGSYVYELKYYENSTEKCEQIGETVKYFQGKTKSVYDLIELLADDKLAFLFNHSVE